MAELLQMFIIPENATPAEQELAKQNMEKYADYRTYLSFEMEQIVEGEERLVIGLSKMIKKNSGGEGQNPLYIALLGVFLFLCIWESRGRYFFQFVPLLLCAGAMPLEGIKRNKP